MLKRKSTKGLAALGLALCVFFLGSCSDAGNADSTTGGAIPSGSGIGQVSGPKGKYREEEYSLPKENSQILALAQLENGSIRCLTDSGVYDSSDSGESWKKADAFAFSEDTLIMNGAIHSDGSVFVVYLDMADESMGMMTAPKYRILSPEGKATELAIALPESDMGVGIGGARSFSMTAEEDGLVSSYRHTEGDSSLADDEGADVTGDGLLSENAVVNSGGMPDDDSDGMFMMPEILDKPVFLADGTLLGSTTLSVFHIDPETGEILAAFPFAWEDGMIEAFDVVDGVLLVLTSENVLGFSLETGDEVELGDAIMQNSKTSASSPQSGGMFINGVSDRLITADKDGKTGYLGNSDGLFRFVEKGSTLEQLVDGEATYFGDPSCQMSALIPLPDHSFLAVFLRSDSFTQVMVRYVYDENVLVEEKATLLVYSLYDNAAVRQAISKFRKSNPEIAVTVQVGLSEDSGMTESDALRKLVTEIMGGNGPDLLILDGMSVDSFVEKDMLMDLTAILEKNGLSDELYDNITSVYAEEGGIYGVPTRFFVPYLVGKRDVVEGLASFKDFADGLEALSAESGANAIGNVAPEYLAELFYRYAAPLLVREDGSLDEALLTDLFEQMKRVYDSQNELFGEDTIAPSLGGARVPMTAFESPLQGAVSLLMEANKLAIVEVSNASEDLSALHSIMTQSEGAGMQSFTLDGKKLFVPSCIAGISSRTDYPEESGLLLAELLSDEVQASSRLLGFPVRKSAMDIVLARPEEENSMAVGVMEEGMKEPVMLSLKFPDEAAIASFREYVGMLDTPAVSDRVILSELKKQVSAALTDGKPIGNAVADMLRTVNLYLAE